MEKKTYEHQESDLLELREDLVFQNSATRTVDGHFPEVQSCPPCTFSDEEWTEEIRLSEESGTASEQETHSFYTKWGIAL